MDRNIFEMAGVAYLQLVRPSGFGLPELGLETTSLYCRNASAKRQDEGSAPVSAAPNVLSGSLVSSKPDLESGNIAGGRPRGTSFDQALGLVSPSFMASCSA